MATSPSTVQEVRRGSVHISSTVTSEKCTRSTPRRLARQQRGGPQDRIQNNKLTSQRVEQLHRPVRTTTKEPRLRRVEGAVQATFWGGRVQPFHWYDRRVRRQVVEDLRVEDLDRAVVRTRRHQRIPRRFRVERRTSQSFVVVL